MSRNVLRRWQSAGLVPLSPITVLEKLPTRFATTASPPHTPSQRTNIDLLLLGSPQPGGIELREANTLLEQSIKASKDIPSPVKRCTERTSRAFEVTHSENVTLRKQLKEAEALLSTRKIHKKDKRVALKGRFVFSTQEVLKTVEEAEAEMTAKNGSKRSRKRKVIQAIEIVNEQSLQESSSQSGSDCIVVRNR
jgi:hypothetical protein